MRNVPLWHEIEREGKGSAGKRKGASWGGVFVLGLCVGDNTRNSSDNHISPPYMGLIWGARTVQTVEFWGAYWTPV